MLYTTIDLQQRMMSGFGQAATFGAAFADAPFLPWRYLGLDERIASALDVFAHTVEQRSKPAFGLDQTTVAGRQVAVREHVLMRRHFGQLKHFAKDGVTGQPKLLIVAPMSGHYATLLRGTVERMLPAHDVYITDWRDARLVPVVHGAFDLDDYIDYLIDWLEFLGEGTHVLAVCQPSVPALAATAIMAQADNPARPRSLTMMGGPVDTREAPTSVNTMATGRPHAWFQNHAIMTVPAYYPGAGRRVYPGFLQLFAFMSMNLSNHMNSHWQMYQNLVVGDEDSAESIKRFYDEYRSVCDMTAEFYLQTVDTVFQRHALPKGELRHRSKPVDCGAIRDVPILAIEGERDDISGLGQTRAAHKITPNLPDRLKRYHMAAGAGHYGIFNGSRWRHDVAPVVEQWIAEAEGRAA